MGSQERPGAVLVIGLTEESGFRFPYGYPLPTSAKQVGLHEGDIVQSINGAHILNMKDLHQAVSALRPFSQMQLTVRSALHGLVSDMQMRVAPLLSQLLPASAALDSLLRAVDPHPSNPAVPFLGLQLNQTTIRISAAKVSANDPQDPSPAKTRILLTVRRHQ
eukprot:gene5359-5385_t